MMGLVAAPRLVFMFGLQAVEAAGELLRKRDGMSACELGSVGVFHRLGWCVDKRGLAFVGGYLVVMVGVVVVLID
jgi:hypothetical protein